MLDKNLVYYIKTQIFPKYDKLYSHGLLHIIC